MDKIIGLMAEKRISQRKMAELLGMNKNTFNAKVNGKAKFTTDEATKICEILGVTDNNLKVQIFLS